MPKVYRTSPTEGDLYRTTVELPVNIYDSLKKFRIDIRDATLTGAEILIDAKRQIRGV